MISDTLFEAEEQIRWEYLLEGWYGKPGDALYDVMTNLVEHITAVRFLPGLDGPPDASRFGIEVAVIRERWGPARPNPDAFLRMELDELLKKWHHHRPMAMNC